MSMLRIGGPTAAKPQAKATDTAFWLNAQDLDTYPSWVSDLEFLAHETQRSNRSISDYAREQRRRALETQAERRSALRRSPGRRAD